MSASAAYAYSSPSYRGPPLPVLVTEKDLPRALLVVALGTLLAALLALQLDAFYTAQDGSEKQDAAFYYPNVGYFLIVYKALMVLSRYQGHGTYILYEALWGCNIAIIFVIMAVFLSKPFLVGVAMAIVSGDQLLWYIDLLSYPFMGKFPTGAVTYLTYPENRSFSKIFFASHHIWFLPLCLKITLGHGGMHESSFVASCVVTTFLSAYCRLLTPFQAKVPGADHIVYLNVNGAFEFWKDIDIPLLHVFDHRHPLVYLPYLAVVGNLVANGMPHMVLMGISLTLQFHPMLQG
ncbi:hypothetical protein FI667_g12080, partial [Globisporangium splendens]